MLNVLSLFDGMSCGQIALSRSGIEYDNYFASEIDKYARRITQNNFPNTVQLGNISEVDGYSLPGVHLLIGGPPCQGFSFSGDGSGFQHPESRLLLEFVRIKKEVEPKYYLLENVVMTKQNKERISELLGTEPIEINSNLVSAQNRRRLYWTNIPNVKRPKDRGIVWGDIREYDAPLNFYYSPKALRWFQGWTKKGRKLRIWKDDEKCQMIEKNHHKNYSLQRFFAIEDTNGLRYITPTECERAQTVPDGYTQGVSNTQRYKMLGNGWTVDVIAHIFKNII